MPTRPRFNVNYYRAPLQIVIVGLLAYMAVRPFFDGEYTADFEAYCPFGGMQALASFFANDSLACSMTSLQISMGIVLVAGTVVMSKLFCSMLCPLGTFTEWLGRIGQRYGLRFTITGFADRALRLLKYALLFATFYFTVEASELFCRQYDPFFAVFTDFGSDVVLLYAIPALVIVAAGSIFIRQFWCKYLCPLGAATNLSLNLIFAGGALALYAGLLYAGLDIHWVWPLAVISLGGFLLESLRMRGVALPLLRVVRNDAICTGCKKCDRVCPYALPVSSAQQVVHIDCHLCTDCIDSCPEQGALTINRKRMPWLPAVVTVALVIGGIALAGTMRIPTINLIWADGKALENAAVLEKEGLRSIKCYGSSMSFASQMREIPGVLAVQTFVGNNAVRIQYDSSVTSRQALLEAMFSPALEFLAVPPSDAKTVASALFLVDGLFDSYDHAQLDDLLRSTKGVYGYETEFGEPVKTVVYFNPRLLNAERLKTILERPSVELQQAGTGVKEGKSFRVRIAETTMERGADEFLGRFFTPVDFTFNNYESIPAAALSVYEIPIPEAVDPEMEEMLTYMGSHLSGVAAIVGLRTEWRTGGPVAIVVFRKNAIDETDILAKLRAPQLDVVFESGKAALIDNPFRFRQQGKVTGFSTVDTQP